MEEQSKTGRKGKEKAEVARSAKALAMAKQEYKRLGERLAAIRKSQPDKPSQMKVSEQVGISLDYYSRVERGEAKPSMEVLCEICLVLDISLQQLFVDPEQQGEWNLRPQALTVELINSEGQKLQKGFRLVEED